MAHVALRRGWLRLRRVLAGALVIVGVGAVLAPTPAAAHGDPALVPVLRHVQPSLPPGLQFGLRNGASAQLVASNPTPTPLLVLTPDGRPFLQVSASGVFGDISSPFLHAPLGLLNRQTAGHWDQITSRSTWSWSDPRIEPPILPDPDRPAPANPVRVDFSSRHTQVASTWTVGLRYGSRTLSAVGVVEYRPFLGSVTTTVTASPPRVAASVIDGPTPAMHLQIPAGSTVEVLGRDHKPFLQLSPTGARMRTGSAEYRLDRRALGLPTRSDLAWVPVGPATKVTWVDDRLRYPGGTPASAPVATAAFQLGQWHIPVIVNRRPGEISGAHTWVPELPLPQAGQGSQHGGPGTQTKTVVGGCALLAAAGVLWGAASRRRPVRSPRRAATPSTIPSGSHHVTAGDPQRHAAPEKVP